MPTLPGHHLISGLNRAGRPKPYADANSTAAQLAAVLFCRIGPREEWSLRATTISVNPQESTQGGQRKKAERRTHQDTCWPVQETDSVPSGWNRYRLEAPIPALDR